MTSAMSFAAATRSMVSWGIIGMRTADFRMRKEEISRCARLVAVQRSATGDTLSLQEFTALGQWGQASLNSAFRNPTSAFPMFRLIDRYLLGELISAVLWTVA